jgi:hypothetical protein
MNLWLDQDRTIVPVSTHHDGLDQLLVASHILSRFGFEPRM